MTFKQVCTVKNNQVVITLPPNFPNTKRVMVVVEDQADPKEKKLGLLREAAHDPLFLADLEEIQQDFKAIDKEGL